jgi:hypothetical protein
MARLILRFIPQITDTPMLSSKLINLKKLDIGVLGSPEAFSPSYDVFSLVSFLDASPVLESFTLWVSHCPHLSALSLIIIYLTHLLER